MSGYATAVDNGAISAATWQAISAVIHRFASEKTVALTEAIIGGLGKAAIGRFTAIVKYLWVIGHRVYR